MYGGFDSFDRRIFLYAKKPDACKTVSSLIFPCKLID